MARLPSTPITIPGRHAVPDEVAALLAAEQAPDGYASQTMEMDKSQPPTPDGTGRPGNFQTIAPGLYRSSYPLFAHFERLSDLDLKTIITLVPEDLPFAYSNFISSNGIIHHHIPILANKDPERFTDAETVHKVLNVMLDPSNYPMLIHCNKGKHRTGCMTACFRKVCGWTAEACIEEYVKYSTPKDRPLDKTFIERFDPSVLKCTAMTRGFLGGPYQPPSGDGRISIGSYASVISDACNTDSSYPGSDYQERIRQENDLALESARLWSYK